MIRVTCPTCHSQFDVQDAHAGRVAKCTNCGGQIQIPQVGAPPMPTSQSGPPPTSSAGPPPVPGGAAASAGQATGNSGVSIAGFTCGLVGFIFSLLEIIPCIGCWLFPLVIPTAVAGVVCSSIGLITAKKTNKKTGLAIAGLVLGVLAIIWAPLVFFLFLGGLGAAGAASGPMSGF